MIFKELYKKYERWVPLVFFILGFIFDAVMLRRVDELMTIVQQAVYLLITALLIRVELIETVRPVVAPPGLGRVWRYREALLHFLMGTLLNAYTIFFFKSASALVPYLFIAILIVVLMLNEFKRFGKSQAKVHMAFWSLCLIAFLATLTPILLGFMGAIPFLTAVGLAVLVFILFYRMVSPSLSEQPNLASTHMRQPFLAILALFVLLYFCRAIPPVPLSVSYMGVFHDIRKNQDTYELSYMRPIWKFWQHGDQTFEARPGDTVHCFVRVFSPARFSDQVHMRWLYRDDAHGWVTSDVIPMAIVGGREEGYRGVSQKNSFQPGKWRVQVETEDNREIGRIRFNIISDADTSERFFKIMRQ